jgi:predicted DNA-binding protein (MmcQ/YjbR family)
MIAEEIIGHCLSKAGAEETYPFGEDILVVKVGGKMFAGINVHRLDSINLKCDPELAINLREKYEAVQPGYHMNKKHWNTVFFDGTVSTSDIMSWVDHSYKLVIDSLPSKVKQAILTK